MTAKVMQFELYSAEGCCLCDKLLERIEPHLQQLRRRAAVSLIKHNIADDAAWLEAYRHRIPVLRLNGAVLLEGNPPDIAVAEAFRAVCVTVE